MTDSKKYPGDKPSPRAAAGGKPAPRRRAPDADRTGKPGFGGAPDRRRENARNDERRPDSRPDSRPGSRPGSRPDDGARRNGPRGPGDAARRGGPRREKFDAPRNERYDDQRRDSAPDREFSDEQQGDRRLQGAVHALIGLDKDLMKLLARRAVLVSRIRGGRDHAGTPDAIQAEKAVRTAWEAGALAFSKDPRFARQLFTLLQDVKVMTKDQAEHAGIFTLAPSAGPVAGELAGPADTRAAQMYAALAACRGDALTLDGVPLSEALMDTVKACAQAGAVVSHRMQGTALGVVDIERGSPLAFTGKLLYLGEDFFTLCLMAFLALGRPGTCRLAGGARLKGADLSVLRHVLPLFGARLAHVVPRSQGLPATLESSGDIPPHVVIPAELPLEAVCALLLAPMAWNVPIVFNLAELPAAVATAALAEVGPIHLACGADVENRGSQLAYAPGPLHVPARPDLPLDPVLSAYLLALPAFAGGSLTLKGRWSAYAPESREAEQLLAWAGLTVRVVDNAIAVEASRPPFAMPLQCNDLAPELGPLFLALAARQHLLDGNSPVLRELAPFSVDDTDQALAQDFFERLGLAYADGRLSRADGQDGAHGKAPGHPAHPAWTSPDAWWGMALALAAFLRPGLRLANPGHVTEVLPPFWGIYNSLPNPADPADEPKVTPRETKDDKPSARRRIIAD